MRLLSHGCLTLHWVPTVSQERAVAARVASAKKNRKGKFWILFQTGVSNSVKKALNHCLGFSGKVFQENLELKNNQHLCHQCIYLPSFAKPSKEVQSKPPKTQQPERPKTAQNGPNGPSLVVSMDGLGHGHGIRMPHPIPGLGGLGAKLIEAHLPHTVADALSRTRELENFKNCFDVDLDGKLETLETEAIGNLLATLYHSLAAV